MLTAVRIHWLAFTILSIILFIYGCASTFNPQPMAEAGFKDRAETKQDGEMRVTASVLSAEESASVFGVNVYKKNIQPIWLEIENKGKESLWFMPIALDPHYLTPLEVAYISRSGVRKSDYDKMDRYFYEHGISYALAAGRIRSGYFFTNLDEGTKGFIVELAGADFGVKHFTFFIPVPGIRVDHHDIEWESLYPENQIVDYDEEGLRKALEDLPCCTTNKKGTEQGDPLNLVVIGDLDDVYYAFIRAGWDETETIYKASLLKTVRSFLFGGRYRYSPVSALYVFGRGQDVAFQIARGSIHERNHLRLWMAPMRFEGKPVWIGQISRDIGVRFTRKTITTHKIDPDVDETREFLLQQLWYSQGLKKFAYVKGVGAAPMSEPRGNLTGDPYFTDGYRAVFWLSGKPVALPAVGFVNWEIPPER